MWRKWIPGIAQGWRAEALNDVFRECVVQPVVILGGDDNALRQPAVSLVLFEPAHITGQLARGVIARSLVGFSSD